MMEKLKEHIFERVPKNAGELNEDFRREIHF